MNSITIPRGYSLNYWRDSIRGAPFDKPAPGHSPSMVR